MPLGSSRANKNLVMYGNQKGKKGTHKMPSGKMMSDKEMAKKHKKKY